MERDGARWAGAGACSWYFEVRTFLLRPIPEEYRGRRICDGDAHKEDGASRLRVHAHHYFPHNPLGEPFWPLGEMLWFHHSKTEHHQKARQPGPIGSKCRDGKETNYAE